MPASFSSVLICSINAWVVDKMRAPSVLPQDTARRAGRDLRTWCGASAFGAASMPRHDH
jgi:hypothetical protein